MKKTHGLSLMLLLLAGVSTACASTGQQRVEAISRGMVGTPAPRMVLKTIDGETIDLGSLYGKKAVYLKFWATWCVPCREQMPHFERVHEQAGADLAVIAINAGFDDTKDQIEAYRRQAGITMPIVLDDGRLAKAFGLRVTPQHIVIGRDGRVRYVGHLADARLDAALQAARVPAGNAAPAVAAPKADDHYGVGDRLPGTVAMTLERLPFPLRDATATRPTVLVFLSPWCESYFVKTRPASAASCRAVREQMARLGQDRRVRWLGVASGLWADEDDLREYRNDHRIAIALALDESGNLFRSFQVARVPVMIVADADGRIVRRIEGQTQDLRGAIDALLAP